jgi:hypothetical protein
LDSTAPSLPDIKLGHLSPGDRRMLDDVAAVVETVARPTARSPDTKAAIAYLTASGAVAVSVIETETGCTFRIGTMIFTNAGKGVARSVAIFWIMEVDAKSVVALARKIAGRGAGGNVAISALHEAAAGIKATLTAHSVAISRGQCGGQARPISGFPAGLRRAA